MPIEYINFKGINYPSFQAQGNAIRWIMPLAQYYCKGNGLDIGCSKQEWCFPNSVPIDPAINEYDAMNLPHGKWDFIVSSHMLEHLQGNWADCLDYWLSKIKDGGILFLYLPHSSQLYWHPESNRKHVHKFNGNEIADYLRSLGHEVLLTPVDYNNSFAVVCEKKTEDGLTKHYMQSPIGGLYSGINTGIISEEFAKELSDQFKKAGSNDCKIEPCGNNPTITQLTDVVAECSKSGNIKCVNCNFNFTIVESETLDSLQIGDICECPSCNILYSYLGNFKFRVPNRFNSK